MKKVVNKLISKGKTISTMESCTGGALANAITNIEGASSVIKFSAVTYSNDFKVKMGVKKEVIDKYTVYSEQTADEMSKNISKFAGSNYGVGITGKLNIVDENNLFGEDNIVFISIYDKDNNKFYKGKIEANRPSRNKNKELVIKKVLDMMLNII